MGNHFSMNDQFKHLLELVKRMGDRLVVTDPDGEHAYVILDLAAYEALRSSSLVSKPVSEITSRPFIPPRPEPRFQAIQELPPPPPEVPLPPTDETSFYLEPIE